MSRKETGEFGKCPFQPCGEQRPKPSPYGTLLLPLIDSAPATWAFILLLDPSAQGICTWYSLCCNIPSQLVTQLTPPQPGDLISVSPPCPFTLKQRYLELSYPSVWFVCLPHWNVRSMSAGPLLSCYLHIAMPVPRRLFIHTWASHPRMDKGKIDQRRALGMVRKLQAALVEERTVVCPFRNLAWG